MSKEEIIEKIRKLLRMKRGGTPDEIATALRKAQELAAQHGVDLDGVNPDEEAETLKPIGETDAFKGARIQFECQYAGHICKEFFNVSVFTARSWVSGHKLKFVGTDWDREIATHVFTFLVRHFRREWRSQAKRLRNRRAFMWGMYVGLASKLRERQPEPQEAGLVLIGRALERRKTFIADNYGDLTSSSLVPTHNARAAMTAGYVAGRKTEIRPAVKDSPEKPRLIG